MNNLKKLRKEKGVTQSEVANFIGISQNNYSYWENEKVKIDNSSLQKLADYFGVTTDYLLGRETQSEKSEIVVPDKYKDVMFAFENGAENLTQEDIDDVIKFIEFLKNKKK